MEVIIKYITPKIYKDVETQTQSMDLKTDDNIFCGRIQLDEIKNTIMKVNGKTGYWIRFKPLISLLNEHSMITTIENEKQTLLNNKIIKKVSKGHYKIIDLQKYCNHYVISNDDQ